MGGKAGKCDMGAADGGAPAVTPPGLTPGVWKNITPAALDMTGTWGTTGITVDPNKSSTLYLDTDQRGLWKSTDWGATWARLGTPPSAPNYGTTANYLDSPVEVRVDPADSQHLYAVQGVRGQTQGLWVSHDGGTTWAQPAGFIASARRHRARRHPEDRTERRGRACVRRLHPLRRRPEARGVDGLHSGAGQRRHAVVVSGRHEDQPDAHGHRQRRAPPTARTSSASPTCSAISAESVATA